MCVVHIAHVACSDLDLVVVFNDRVKEFLELVVSGGTSGINSDAGVGVLAPG